MSGRQDRRGPDGAGGSATDSEGSWRDVLPDRRERERERESPAMLKDPIGGDFPGHAARPDDQAELMVKILTINKKASECVYARAPDRASALPPASPCVAGE